MTLGKFHPAQCTSLGFGVWFIRSDTQECEQVLRLNWFRYGHCRTGEWQSLLVLAGIVLIGFSDLLVPTLPLKVFHEEPPTIDGYITHHLIW